MPLTETVNLGLVIGAGTILLLSLVDDWMKARLWISEPIVAVGVGVLIGPVTGLFTLDVIGSAPDRDLLEHVARLTVALSVMAAAFRLPSGYVRRHLRGLAVVLTAGMAAMAALSFLYSLVLPGMGVVALLAIAAAITPTDPVLAGGIVQGELAHRHVDAETRHAISAESGANDGLALPLVAAPLLLLDGFSGGPLAAELLGRYFLLEIVGGGLFGLALGWATGAGFRWGNAHRSTDRKTLTAVTFALTAVALSAARLLSMDGIFAVFTAGLAFDASLRAQRAERSVHFEETVDRVFTLPVFILLGVALPVGEWLVMGWPLVLFVLLAVCLRRLPLFWFAAPFTRLFPHDAAARFSGWFGPIGAAAIFYATYAVREGADPAVFVVVSAVVTGSVLIHGLSATPITRRFSV